MRSRRRHPGIVDRVKLGVFGLNSKATIGPAATARLARRCEELGYDSWWVGEHVVLPSPRVPPAPMEPTDSILDPLVHLAFVAGATDRMLLGTGIIIVPQRNPLVLRSLPGHVNLAGLRPTDNQPRLRGRSEPETSCK